MTKTNMLEIILILISATIIFLIYFARYKTNGTKTFLFPESFLEKADEAIFGIIKFVYKLYILFFQNVKTFFATVPHAVVHFVHRVSKFIAHKTQDLIEKFKKPHQK